MTSFSAGKDKVTLLIRTEIGIAFLEIHLAMYGKCMNSSNALWDTNPLPRIKNTTTVYKIYTLAAERFVNKQEINYATPMWLTMPLTWSLGRNIKWNRKTCDKTTMFIHYDLSICIYWKWLYHIFKSSWFGQLDHEWCLFLSVYFFNVFQIFCNNKNAIFIIIKIFKTISSDISPLCKITLYFLIAWW